MRASVRKMGNSSGVITPKPILTELGVKAGDEVEMTFESGKVTLAPIESIPRRLGRRRAGDCSGRGRRLGVAGVWQSR